MLVSQSSLCSCITLAYLLATHCHICLLCTCKPTPTDAYYFGFNILRSAQVKSYLAGNPPIKIKLNDDLLITRRDGRGYSGGGYGSGGGFSAGDYASDSSLVILDDVNFHEVCAGCKVGRTGACMDVHVCVLRH
jgi:hypothetical protein